MVGGLVAGAIAAMVGGDVGVVGASSWEAALSHFQVGIQIDPNPESYNKNRDMAHN